jgi:hypothetical protein
MHGAIALVKPIKLEGQALDAFLAVKEIVRRAVLTLAAIKDPDERYRRGLASTWTLPVVHDAETAYGYGTPTIAKFVPSPRDVSQMEVVTTWLVWLRRTEGELSVKRIIGWAKGIPGWMLGTKERCSERTIKNRIDRSISSIIEEFAGASLIVEIVHDESKPIVDLSPRQGRADGPFSIVIEKAPGPHGERVVLKKVYVHDIGFLIGSKRLRDGRHKADKFAS